MVSGGTVRVHDVAPRCADLIRRERTWTPSAATAMVCQDVDVVPEPSLPAGLTLQPVRRVLQDPGDGVPLKEAVAAAARATSASDASSDALASYLKSLPGDPLLFAAVDQDGIVRGTSGSDLRDLRVRVLRQHRPRLAAPRRRAGDDCGRAALLSAGGRDTRMSGCERLRRCTVPTAGVHRRRSDHPVLSPQLSSARQAHLASSPVPAPCSKEFTHLEQEDATRWGTVSCHTALTIWPRFGPPGGDSRPYRFHDHDEQRDPRLPPRSRGIARRRQTPTRRARAVACTTTSGADPTCRAESSRRARHRP